MDLFPLGNRRDKQIGEGEYTQYTSKGQEVKFEEVGNYISTNNKFSLLLIDV
jgi:hypothetical protein